MPVLFNNSTGRVYRQAFTVLQRLPRPDKSGLAMTRWEGREFQGHHTNQAYYKSGITSPEYHEIKGADGEFWLRVELE
jgi:hypothetical protein